VEHATWQAPEAIDRLSTQLRPAAVGDRRSRLDDRGRRTTPATSKATMPIDSSTPKSCTIGTLEIFTVKNAMTAAIVAATNGGPMWTSVVSNGL
jgi:hypothetical protein